jgi:hypothetical protein
MEKKKFILFMLLFLFSFSCFAVLPVVVSFGRFLTPISSALIARGWQRAVADPLFTRLLELSVYTHAGIMSIHFSTKPVTNNGQSIESSAIHAILSGVDEKRQNPDPSKWDDPQGSSYDPTPKDTVPRGGGSVTLPAPSTYPLVVQDIGGSGDRYYSYDQLNDIHYLVLHRANGACTGYRDDAPPLYTGAWCGSVSIEGSASAFAVYYRLIPTSCPTGYQASGTSCELVDPMAVMKPADTIPCEIVFDPATGTWESDSRNPECGNFQGTTDGSFSIEGPTLRITDSEGDSATITRRPDGGFNINSPTPDGGTREVVTGPRAPDAGGPGRPGHPVTSITDKPPGSGGGNGNGNGNGSSGGSCGGPNQPPCVIDDSGFKDLNPKFSDVVEKAWDDRIEGLNALKDQGDFGVNTSWIPSLLPGPVVSCRALEWPVKVRMMGITVADQIVRIELCDKFEIFREYYSWLFGFLTVVFIAKLFFRSNEGGA